MLKKMTQEIILCKEREQEINSLLGFSWKYFDIVYHVNTEFKGYILYMYIPQ